MPILRPRFHSCFILLTSIHYPHLCPALSARLACRLLSAIPSRQPGLPSLRHICAAIAASSGLPPRRPSPLAYFCRICAFRKLILTLNLSISITRFTSPHLPPRKHSSYDQPPARRTFIYTFHLLLGCTVRSPIRLHDRNLRLPYARDCCARAFSV